MANVSYRVKLFARNGAYLADISDELVSRNRGINLNGIDTFGFGLSTRAANAGLVQPLSTFVRMWRDVEGRAPRPEGFPNFCGWVGQPSKSAKNKSMTFMSYSPIWRLQSRFHIDVHDFGDPTAAGASYEAVNNPNTPMTPSQILWKMIENTAQVTSPDDWMGMALGALNTAEKTWWERYPRGQSTWELLTNFLGKGLFDLFPTYVSDPGNPDRMILFNTVTKRGVARSSPKFEFIADKEDPRYPGNLDDMTEAVSTEPGSFATYVVVQGPGDRKVDRAIWEADGGSRSMDWLGDMYVTYDGIPTRTNPPFTTLPNDMNDIGVYQLWEKNNLAMFQDQRDAHAFAKLKRMHAPPQVLSAVFPPGSDSGFEHDWNVGDVMLCSCDEGAMSFTDVSRRVAAVNLTLDDLGAETCAVTLVEDYADVA